MSVNGLLLAALAAVFMAGCGGSAAQAPLAADPNAVRLATGPAPDPNYCAYLSYGQGELIEDAALGVAYRDQYAVHPLTWPPGFSARRSGGNVEVLSASGEVIAVTGRLYQFNGPSWPTWTGGPGCLRELASLIPG